MSYADQNQYDAYQQGGRGGQQAGRQQGRQGGGMQQQQQQQQGQQGQVVSKAPVLRLSGAPQFIVPPSPKPEPDRPKKQWNMDQLRQTDGLVPSQYGSNQFASQKNMTGFGTPRDVGGKHLHRFWEFMGDDECAGLERDQFSFGGNISGAQAAAMRQQQQPQQQQYQQYQQQQYQQ